MGTIKIFDLNQLIQKYNTSVFIETGTLHGEGIINALKYPFKKIISIEIVPELAEAARQKFKQHQHVEILTGNSADILKEILPTIKENIIFWLDAHFPGVEGKFNSFNEIKKNNYNINLPLEQEIDYISKRINLNKDVLICDDLRVYEDVGNLTDFDTHCKNHNIDIKLEDINPGKNLSFLYEKFAKTHNFKKIYQHQGYVTVYPK